MSKVKFPVGYDIFQRAQRWIRKGSHEQDSNLLAAQSFYFDRSNHDHEAIRDPRQPSWEFVVLSETEQGLSGSSLVHLKTIWNVLGLLFSFCFVAHLSIFSGLWFFFLQWRFMTWFEGAT